MDGVTVVAFGAGTATGVVLTMTWTLAVRRAPAVLGMTAVATVLAALAAVATLVATLVRG